MIAAFAIEPIGTGDRSLTRYIAKVTEIVGQSNLEYKLNDMTTEISGEWDEVMDVIGKCYSEILKETGRAIMHITVDKRDDKKYKLGDKVKAVERYLGREVKK